MSIRKKHRGNAEVHVGPLNDILFILLLFFLIVSTLANPNVIKLTPPKSESDTQTKQSLIISIDASGKYFVGTTKVLFEELASSIEAFKIRSNAPISIVINSDKTVPVDQVVQVMRVARKLGVTTSLAVQSQ